MTPYYDDGQIQIWNADCRAVPVAGVDSIVTDPPYDLTDIGRSIKHRQNGVSTHHDNANRQVVARTPGGFMGAKWDATGVAFDPETWRVIFGALKPGGRLLAFGGTRTHHRMVCAIEDAGFVIEDTIAWLYGSGFPKHKSKLKPAFEPVVVAWKPDTRATPLRIDACRIGTAPDDPNRRTAEPHYYGQNAAGFGTVTGRRGDFAPLGRWPANVTLDEVAAAALDAQSGERPSTGSPGRPPKPCKVTPKPGMFVSFGDVQGPLYADSGGASRFFYCAKASRSERGDGNDHPTVKPLALMRWLVRLVTPPGGVCYDPFAGSGTTLLAARSEGFRAVGCDLSEHNCGIAVSRLGGQVAMPLEIPA